MTYSGVEEVTRARDELSSALAVLQQDDAMPDDVLVVTEHIAQSVSALFEAEKASSESDGKACVRSSLGFLSQTLALLQDVRDTHQGVDKATDIIARAMNVLYPLTMRPTRSVIPPEQINQALMDRAAGTAADIEGDATLKMDKAPSYALQSDVAANDTTEDEPLEGRPVEANIGATTESNFYVGFAGEIAEGGVFLATYDIIPKDTPVALLVTLPGGFEFRVKGVVRFVRDPMHMGSEMNPGIGIQFQNLSQQARNLVLRFIRKRAPMFYDD